MPTTHFYKKNSNKSAGAFFGEEKPIEKLNAREKLDAMSQRSSRVLYTVKSVFPFDFFPDEIIVDENKITIKHGLFFFMSHSFTVYIQDIKVVKVTTGVFFASIEIEITGYETNPEVMRYLPKKNALEIKEIILGLTAARDAGIDTQELDQNELTEKIIQIGQAHETTS